MAGISISNCYFFTDGHVEISGYMQCDADTTITVAGALVELPGNIGLGTSDPLSSDGAPMGWMVAFQPTAGIWEYGTGVATAVVLGEGGERLAMDLNPHIVIQSGLG